MAGLCNRTALHIDSHCMRKVLQDRAHLFLTIYKPLSTDNLSCMYLRMDVVWKMIDGKCLLYIFLWSLKGGRHTEYLPELTLVATVSIVVYALGGNHYFCHVEVDVCATSHTRRDDEIGMVVVYHFHGTNGTVHFADAALLHDYFIVANLSNHEILVVLSLCL